MGHLVAIGKPYYHAVVNAGGLLAGGRARDGETTVSWLDIINADKKKDLYDLLAAVLDITWQEAKELLKAIKHDDSFEWD